MRLISTLSTIKEESRKTVMTINKVCYFYHSSSGSFKWKYTVFAFDSESGKVIDSIDLSETLRDVYLDEHTRMVQSHESLFFLSRFAGEIRVHKVSQLSATRPKLESKSSLESRAVDFSVTLFKDKRIFLTGGRHVDDNLNLTSSYSIEDDQWQSEPSLKIARDQHSSCSLG